MVWVTFENLILLADGEDDEGCEVQILLRDTLHVGNRDGVNAGPVFLIVVRLFRVATGEFVLGESADGLGLARKRTWESIDEATLGGVEFLGADGFLRDAFDFVEYDRGS